MTSAEQKIVSRIRHIITEGLNIEKVMENTKTVIAVESMETLEVRIRFEDLLVEPILQGLFCGFKNHEEADEVLACLQYSQRYLTEKDSGQIMQSPTLCARCREPLLAGTIAYLSSNFDGMTCDKCYFTKEMPSEIFSTDGSEDISENED